MAAHIDRIINIADTLLRSLCGVPSPGARPVPRENSDTGEPCEPTLDESEKRHSRGLMRVNHTGEVCAQALYEGQALTSRSPDIKAHLRSAAAGERDHLSWCADRLTELGGKPSILNPGFHAASFLLGSGIGLLDEKIGLGFVSATEESVVEHLDRHLQSLPTSDGRSRAILAAMRDEESAHRTDALAAGGLEFSPGVKRFMRLASKVMTTTTYRV